jgi:hypothetical protein
MSKRFVRRSPFVKLSFFIGAILLISTMSACQTSSETPVQTQPDLNSSSPPIARSAQIPSSSPQPVAPAASGVAPAAPEAVAFDLAIERAANALFSAAERDPELANRLPQSVMIDPLVDGNTAQQTVSSAAMGLKIANIMSAKFNRFNLVAFRESSRSKNPLLLVGTLTAINASNAPQGRNDLYRICLALVDIGHGKVVAKGVGRATEKTVDATPLAFFSDSPALVRDKNTDGYIHTCQGTRAGDPADYRRSCQRLSGQQLRRCQEAISSGCGDASGRAETRRHGALPYELEAAPNQRCGKRIHHPCKQCDGRKTLRNEILVSTWLDQLCRQQ